MSKEEAERFWRIYGKDHFSNPPLDPSFEDLYQAIKARLQHEVMASGFGQLLDRKDG